MKGLFKTLVKDGAILFSSLLVSALTIGVSPALADEYTIPISGPATILFITPDTASTQESAPAINVHVSYEPNGGIPLSEASQVTFFYSVTNSGNVPVSDISISDANCPPISYDAVGQDLNVDHKLDKNEVWTYFCTKTLDSTSTIDVTATGKSDGKTVSSHFSKTVTVAGSIKSSVPKVMPNAGLGGSSKKKSSTARISTVRATVKKTLKVAAVTKPSQEELLIPSLGVKADIIPVGLGSKGEMLLPSDAGDVGMYSFGAQPGEAGNTVLAGHLDTYAGSGVFANLKALRSGDDIYIYGSNKGNLHYSVTSSETFAADESPLSDSDKPRLTLITCSGSWDSVNHRYSRRLVVSADLL